MGWNRKMDKNKIKNKKRRKYAYITKADIVTSTEK